MTDDHDALSRSLMLELMQQLSERIDGGHTRLRQSVNELTVEVRTGFDRMGDHLTDHSGRLLVIETIRKTEAKSDARRRQDARERTVLITTVTSILVTIGIFVLKALLHL
jgi:hypothetical protein